MPRDEEREESRDANPGYAAFQIAHALATSESHSDPATRERAREKVNKWVSVLEGMLSGSLTIGSRQPMASVPVWATPEVVMGGFATGQLLAAGPLQAHELELAARIAPARAGMERRQLNGYFLTESGLTELTERLRSGCYEIRVPEEGALLVVAWLVANDRADKAREIIDALSPHFATLRFYPIPTQRAKNFGARIFLESVATVRERLRRIAPNPRLLAEREAIQVWTPLYEQMLGLFLETVNGDVPTIAPDDEGRWASLETRRFHIAGGWPCQNYPSGWSERAKALSAAIERARATHKLCGKPGRTNDSFARLHGFLNRCAENSASLSGRDVGMIRLILARHIAKRGAPGSPRFEDIRRRQLAQVATPLHHHLSTLVEERLATHSPDTGLDDVDVVLQPVTNDEADSDKLPTGSPIPPSIARKVSRCLCDTADALVARGIVTSGETLARVIPQFTSGLRAQAFDDLQLRNLYASIYRAFRRRRSLLLLNLEKQVRIEELPWVAAIDEYRRKDISARDLSRQTLADVAALTLRAFPQAILPNKLLQEFVALAKGGELDLPFIEELAADIFMDDFSPKFTQAAKHAAAVMEGTLYARYYDLDCAALRSLSAAKPEPTRRSWFSRNRETPANPFAALCIRRAGADESKRWDVARNGMVIEQAQILTTHNLALLFGPLTLGETLRGELRDMSERCFRWICRRQQVKSDKWHAKLIMLKQTAYAWRQMIFYASLLAPDERQGFIAWAEGHLHEQPADFRARFAPALRGLVLANEGRSLDESTEARPFLGWTQKRHWLLSAETPSA